MYLWCDTHRVCNKRCGQVHRTIVTRRPGGARYCKTANRSEKQLYVSGVSSLQPRTSTLRIHVYPHCHNTTALSTLQRTIHSKGDKSLILSIVSFIGCFFCTALCCPGVSMLCHIPAMLFAAKVWPCVVNAYTVCMVCNLVVRGSVITVVLWFLVPFTHHAHCSHSCFWPCSPSCYVHTALLCLELWWHAVSVFVGEGKDGLADMTHFGPTMYLWGECLLYVGSFHGGFGQPVWNS